MMLAVSLAVSACNPAFHDLGHPAELSEPNLAANTPELIPPPEPRVVGYEDRYTMASNSIWSERNGHLFRDNRAFREGDLLTVRIFMDDSAAIQNASELESKAKGGIAAAGTYSVSNHNPSASLDASLDLSGTAQRGGTVDRKEKIQLSVAVVVVRASPNGNLFIRGTQEVRVNHELRLLTVEGVIRTTDILPNNTIPYDKIAEARISYGGANTRSVTPHWPAPQPAGAAYVAPSAAASAPVPLVYTGKQGG
jgi:flagellar L-ring protein precursor FlgH